MGKWLQLCGYVLDQKLTYHCLLSAVMQVSMFEWRGGYRQGAKFEFFSIFLAKFPTRTTRKLLKSDKISLSVFKNTTVWEKICGQNLGESGQRKCSYATPMPIPPSLSEHWYLHNSLMDFSRKNFPWCKMHLIIHISFSDLVRQNKIIIKILFWVIILGLLWWFGLSKILLFGNAFLLPASLNNTVLVFL